MKPVAQSGSSECPGCMQSPLSRRELLKAASNGFGLLALSALAVDESYAGISGPRGPHFAPKVKNVIFCFMPGGVSHMDSFDPKPKLADLDGKASEKPKRKWLKCPWSFQNYGQAGLPVSELFPQIATCIDDLAIIRSMKAEFPLHARGNIFLHTGRNIGGFPSLGSWVTYGLGSENKNLPGYLLLRSGDVPPGGLENFSNGFLPATHQAMEVMAEGVPIGNITPADKDERVQKAKLQVLLQEDRQFASRLGANDAVESAISNYEMAYRMQSLAPDVLNLDKETEATKRLYGLDAKDQHKRNYAVQCLRARRLVESGVRFVEITCPSLFGMNGTWDQHTELKKGHETNAMVTDQAIAGLIKDLKSRGLFQETLIVWAGEFGRTPDTANGDGRDHHTAGFTIWLAGGGIKGGIAYGATDEIGNEAVENIVTIHDLHATIFHLLGLDHEKLTYRFGGREMRLTDVSGNIIKPILA